MPRPCAVEHSRSELCIYKRQTPRFKRVASERFSLLFCSFEREDHGTSTWDPNPKYKNAAGGQGVNHLRHEASVHSALETDLELKTYFTFTSISFGRAVSTFGNVTLRSPSAKSALISFPSTNGGSEKLRTNSPYVRSMR